MPRFDRTYDVSNNGNGNPKPVRRPKDRPAHLVYDEVRGTWVDQAQIPTTYPLRWISSQRQRRLKRLK